MGNRLTQVIEGSNTYGDGRVCLGFEISDCGHQVEIIPISPNGRPVRKHRLAVSLRLLRDLVSALDAADVVAHLRGSVANYKAQPIKPRTRRRAGATPASTNGKAAHAANGVSRH